VSKPKVLPRGYPGFPDFTQVIAVVEHELLIVWLIYNKSLGGRMHQNTIVTNMQRHRWYLIIPHRRVGMAGLQQVTAITHRGTVLLATH
jgi:hypothetical protein